MCKKMWQTLLGCRPVILMIVCPIVETNIVVDHHLDDTMTVIEDGGGAPIVALVDSASMEV